MKKQKPLKNHCVVKIQVPLDTKSNAALMVYNEERSVCGFLYREEGQEDTYDKLRQEIAHTGFQGLKAFYYAIYKTSKMVERSRVEVVEESCRNVDWLS